MQIKMQDILGYTAFYEAVKDQKMPTKTAYKLAKIAKEVEGEISFYQEKLRKIVLEHGLLDEQGNPVPTEDGMGIKLREGHEQACNDAMEELQSIEVVIGNYALTLEELDSLEISLTEMGYIMPFIEEN